MSFETAALVLAWIAILLLAFAMSGLLRQMHFLSTQEVAGPQLGPSRGSMAPILGAISPASTILVFARKDCRSCEVLLPELSKLAESADGMSFAVVYPEDANGFTSDAVKVLSNEKEAFLNYQIPVTPFGVAVDPDGYVSHAEPLGSQVALRRFVEEARKGGATSGR